jgi:protein TonB
VPPGGNSKTDSIRPPKERRATATSQSVAIVKTAPTARSDKEVPTRQDTESPSTEGDQKAIPGIIDDEGDDSGEGGRGGRGGRQIGPGSGTQTILRPGGDVRPPQLIARVEPAYPEIEIKLRREGTVILEAIITTDGAVNEVRVLKSANAILDEAAKQAVMQWRYRPATLNGRAVNVYLTVTVSFRLH